MSNKIVIGIKYRIEYRISNVIWNINVKENRISNINIISNIIDNKVYHISIK